MTYDEEIGELIRLAETGRIQLTSAEETVSSTVLKFQLLAHPDAKFEVYKINRISTLNGLLSSLYGLASFLTKDGKTSELTMRTSDAGARLISNLFRAVQCFGVMQGTQEHREWLRGKLGLSS